MRSGERQRELEEAEEKRALGCSRMKMIDKQDDTIDEGLRRNQKYNLYQRFEHLESELAEIKSALRERGII